MRFDAGQCHRALKSRDARFDGRFFTGVKTTGIYCRPICPARAPLPRNCTYFASAAAAELAGFRPCLRCRPELAPGLASVDANRRLASAAAQLIDDGALTDGSLETIAARLGVTTRHLRRVFQAELGVPPVAYAQTQRLLLAKALLTDTTLGVLEIAMAAGFGSLRRFNDLFTKRYRLTPTALRRTSSAKVAASQLVFELGYRPPYDWASMLAFLRARAIVGVEDVDGEIYRRTVRVGTQHGWVEVAPSSSRGTRSALRVVISESLSRALPTVLSRIKALFDLACHPDEIARALGRVARNHPGLRVPGAIDGFEIAVRAILGQQITVKAATTITGRLIAALGEPVTTPHAALTRLFPTPERVARLSIDRVARHGVIRARAEAILALARALRDGRLVLDSIANVPQTIAALEALPGIGAWTAQYIAMRALRWPDAFPHPDVAVLKAMGTTDRRGALAASEAWRPFRAYAVLHLWKSVETRS